MWKKRVFRSIIDIAENMRWKNSKNSVEKQSYGDQTDKMDQKKQSVSCLIKKKTFCRKYNNLNMTMGQIYERGWMTAKFLLHKRVYF